MFSPACLPLPAVPSPAALDAAGGVGWSLAEQQRIIGAAEQTARTNIACRSPVRVSPLGLGEQNKDASLPP